MADTTTMPRGLAALLTGVLALVLALGAGLPASAETEPNNVQAGASTLTPGVTGDRAAAIGTGGDVDWYKFTAPQAGTYTVEAFDVADGLRLWVDGYDAAGTRVAPGVSGSGRAYSRAIMKVSTPGTYFVRAYPLSSTDSGTYSIRVLPQYDQGLTWDADKEPNDTLWTAAALSVGVSSIRTSIATLNPAHEWYAADQDWFRFTAPKAGTYTAEVHSVAAGLRLWVDGYNAAGTRVAAGVAGSGRGYSRAIIKVSTPGTYFVRAYPLSSSDSGTYKIRVLPQYDQGLTWDANHESNDTQSTAAPLTVGASSAVSTSIAPLDPAYEWYAADQDWFRFSAPTAGTYTVEAFDVGSGMSLGVEGYNASGTRVASGTSGSGAVQRRVVISVSIPGTYFVRAYPFSSAHSGAYRLRVLS